MRSGAGAVLVPLNTRYKGAEAAYILRASGARILFTVQGFLGTDYPALLDGAVATGADAACRTWNRSWCCVPTAPPAQGRTGGVPTTGWDEFLGAAERCEPDVGCRADGLDRRLRPVGPDLHLGDDGPPEGGDDHPRPDPADVRHLVRGGRADVRATAT